MAFTADSLSDFKSLDSGAELCDLAHIFMADGHRRFDMLGRPGIPVIYVYVGPADRCLVDLDKDLSGSGNGYRHTSQFQPRLCNGLYDSIHHSFHNSTFDLPFLISCDQLSRGFAQSLTDKVNKGRSSEVLPY
jgi:hypothetical protein